MESVDLRVARPPYRAASAVFVFVLAVYVWTLAPTVTFWDAGEFIAAAKILGIPHPPGTPLFVLVAHVWGGVFPFGEFALRTNVLTALFSAAAAALLFLLIAQALRGWEVLKRTGSDGGSVEGGEKDRLFVLGGAVAAAIVSAFTFTVWQNSNETEVYMVAAFSIAAVSWLAWLWRKHRGRERAPHILLLIVYLAGVSIGNHLLTLLVGPALIGFMWHVLRTDPLPNERDRKTEWAQWAVVLGVWALLIGLGLGKVELLILGGIIFVAAAVYAATVGASMFALTVLATALVGASTYLFLLIRAQVGPFLNEADPSTWDNLWAVISRAQYPPRSPIDNPIYTSRAVGFVDRLGAFVTCLPHWVDGPVPADRAPFGIPECYTVRSIPLMLRQAQMYLQYFDWQWANGLAPHDPVFALQTPLFSIPAPGGSIPVPVRMPFTLAAVSLGVYGALLLHRRDRSVFWFLTLLFLTTGPGLVGYMNFKPGYSLAWDVYPSIEMHEVRERDYFFTVSFQVWGLFIGLGLAGIFAWVRDRLPGKSITIGGRSVTPAAAVLLLALLPLALNFRAASRAHGPDARLARDFAYDLLQSVEPYGIVYTNGDNDTFSLWYLQEVEGVRQDVSVVNLSLGNTDWYIRQLRDNPVRPFDPEQAPWYASLAPSEPPPPVHTLTDREIEEFQSMLLPRAMTFGAGRVAITYPENSPLYTFDMLILRLLQENWERRPIYFSMTSGQSNWSRFGDYLTQHGLVFKLNAHEPPDTARLAPGLFGVPLDVPRTDSLVWDVYRYAGIMEADSAELDPTSRSIAINLAYPFYGLAWAYELRGDTAQADANSRRGLKLYYLPEVARTLDSGRPLFTAPVEISDTPLPPP